MKTVLTIAGSDPSGWAGLQADLSVFASLGARGLSAVAALTAQNCLEVKATFPVPASFVKQQVFALLDEFKVDAVKIGMLGSTSNIKAAAEIIRSAKLHNIVLDPVFFSTSGYPLMKGTGVAAYKALLSFITVVTPNLAEAQALTGLIVNDVESMKEAARILTGLGAASALVKGGHLKGEAVDVLYDGKAYRYLCTKRLKGDNKIFHGTGCILSSALAVGLAKGYSTGRSAQDAKEHLIETLKARGGRRQTNTSAYFTALG
ncbi:MAG: bifunctional hydroxymethylpyrimidine kinase/phosphomethylpyrimidine kinase [Deltaproteobacteria bacterium]|nr:bifunctional hydroxymethylpyrimidine kinase/phosphomethylpyrimidine kinase [Deltaproteobacteria bacterium]